MSCVSTRGKELFLLVELENKLLTGTDSWAQMCFKHLSNQQQPIISPIRVLNMYIPYSFSQRKGYKWGEKLPNCTVVCEFAMGSFFFFFFKLSMCLTLICLMWYKLKWSRNLERLLTSLFGCECACQVASVVPSSLRPCGLSLPGSSVHGIQVRILQWVAMPSSRRTSQPRDRTCVSGKSPALAAGFFTTCATWES